MLARLNQAIELMSIQGKNVPGGSQTTLFLKEGALRDVRRGLSLAVGMAGYPARIPEWALLRLSKVGIDKYDEILGKVLFEPDSA